MRKAAGGATHALAETCGTATLFLNREKECIGIQIIAVVSVIGDRIRKIRLSDPPPSSSLRLLSRIISWPLVRLWSASLHARGGYVSDLPVCI